MPKNECQRMVDEQLRPRGIVDERVLAVMAALDRRRFVPPSHQAEAFGDFPLPIGDGATISQPYIVALMTEALALRGHERVLEIGSGCGYQSAVLASLAAQLYSIEIVPALSLRARQTLEELGIANASLAVGDGYDGWPEAAPFDAILLSAAPRTLPPPLLAQLAPGGRLVAPVGVFEQELLLVERQADGSLARRWLGGVRFVPMLGRAQRGD